MSYQKNIFHRPLIIVFMGFLASALLVAPAPVPASDRNERGGRHERGDRHERSDRHERFDHRGRSDHRDRVVVRLPAGHRRARVHGADYYYHRGAFFRRSSVGLFFSVGAPIGAVVTTLPYGYRTVVIDGSPGYWYDGVYYRRVPSGYTVVQGPPQVLVSRQTPIAVAPEQPSIYSVTVTAQALNVRTGPDLDFSAIRHVNRGDVLEVYADENKWLNVRLPTGEHGWIMEQFTDRLVMPASG